MQIPNPFSTSRGSPAATSLSLGGSFFWPRSWGSPCSRPRPRYAHGLYPSRSPRAEATITWTVSIVRSSTLGRLQCYQSLTQFKLMNKGCWLGRVQAVVVAVLFNAHSIEVLEDALDALSKEQLPFGGTTLLPWVTKLLDSARQRMARGSPMVSHPTPPHERFSSLLAPDLLFSVLLPPVPLCSNLPSSVLLSSVLLSTCPSLPCGRRAPQGAAAAPLSAVWCHRSWCSCSWASWGPS